MHELKISPDYPNNYWFEYEQGKVSNNDLMQGKEIKTDENLVFKLKKKLAKKHPIL